MRLSTLLETNGKHLLLDIQAKVVDTWPWVETELLAINKVPTSVHATNYYGDPELYLGAIAAWIEGIPRVHLLLTKDDDERHSVIVTTRPALVNKAFAASIRTALLESFCEARKIEHSADDSVLRVMKRVGEGKVKADDVFELIVTEDEYSTGGTEKEHDADIFGMRALSDAKIALLLVKSR